MENHIIDEIYESGALPDLWPELLAQLQDSVGAAAGILTNVGATAPKVLTSGSGAALAEEWLSFIGDDFAGNVRTAGLLRSGYSGFLTDEDVVSDADFKQNPLYTKFLRPRGYGHCTACSIPVPNGDHFIFHFERRWSDGRVDERSIAWLDQLKPHLARAAILSARLGYRQAVAMTDALQSMDIAAAAITLTGRVVSVNTLLEAYIPAAMTDTPSGLRLTDAKAQKLLKRAMNDLCTGRMTAPQSIPVRPHDDLYLIIVHLVPIRRQARDIFVSADALLILMPVVVEAVADARLIQGLFDLTPAEAEIARGIASGQTIADLAKYKNLSRNTVRNQLSCIFEKTGCSRQAELVRLLQVTKIRGK